MDFGHLANPNLRQPDPRQKLVGPRLGDAAVLGECNVRLYLAFFRQSPFPGVARHRPSGPDPRGELHPLFGSLVDLAIAYPRPIY